MVEFLKLSQNKANIKQAADQVKNAQKSGSATGSSKSALPNMGDREVKTNSIFTSGSGSTETTKNSVSGQDFVEALSGKGIEELDKAQKAQFDLLAAFADQDGNGEITNEEATVLDLTEDGMISQADIDAIYEELGIGSDASVDELLDAIDDILNDRETEEVKGINLNNSGVVEHVDEETGDKTFTVEVEPWGSQAEGRQANDCLTRIIANAYPDMSAADRQAIMSEICSMNNITNPNVISTGANLQLPIISHDDNGQIQFTDKLEAPEKPEAATEETAETEESTPRMVNNRGYEAEYEIQNEDGTTTRFTVAAGQEASIENAQGNIITDGKDEDGNFQRTIQNGDVTTQYTYSGDKVDGQPTTIKTTNADGTSSIETRTYDANGNVATREVQEFDADGNLVEKEDAGNEANYQQRLTDINSSSDLIERTSVLNTTLSGDYGLSAQEKADLINEVLSGYNSGPGDSQYYVKDDNADALRTNINSVISDLSDEEFMQFAKDFETSFGKPLTEFMDVEDNSQTNTDYVIRLTHLYSNAGANLPQVLEQFPITDSVQKLLSQDGETTAITNILNGTLDNVPYEEGQNARIDTIAAGIDSKGDLSDMLNSNQYTDQEKAQILKQMGAAKVTEYLRDMNLSSNQEKYLTQILGYVANASVDA